MIRPPCSFNINNKMWGHLPGNQYLTMFYGVLDPASGQLIYSSAGHNPPVWVDRGCGRCEYLEGCEGYPIKLVAPNLNYSNQRINLGPGQNLVLYTDGLIDAYNEHDNLFGPKRLLHLALTLKDLDPDQMIQVMVDDLWSYRTSDDLDDDLSILIIKRR
jgi:sigma-B regulation protein RsbU (phosphoserine phosphatase)